MNRSLVNGHPVCGDGSPGLIAAVELEGKDVAGPGRKEKEVHQTVLSRIFEGHR